MIKKLRLKFTLILMGVVTLILLAVFTITLVTTMKNNEFSSVGMLQMLLRQPPAENAMEPPLGGWTPPSRGVRPEELRRPVMLAEVGLSGEISIRVNLLYFIDEKDVQDVVTLAIESTKDTGVLRGYRLRYLREFTDGGALIAFADISTEQDMLRNLVVTSFLAGGAALIAFFIVSLLLARWAVRPVEAAWDRQRQFVADASHELKTPLTVILSNVNMLGAGHSDEDKKKARRIEHIQAEAVRMRGLVEEMLALAKSDSVEKSAVLDCVDFSDVVKDAALTFEPIVYDEKKKLRDDIQSGLHVMGDTERLRQLLRILLDNALKYCPVGGQIEVSLKETGRNQALLNVSNEGQPIPREELGQIFGRFYRLDESRSMQKGFGLGLAIADNIVREHGGKVWAESEETLGNCFFVSLPLK